MKKCPFCAEEIQDESIKCKHCGEMVKPRRYKIIRSIKNAPTMWEVDQPTLNQWIQEKRILPTDQIYDLDNNQSVVQNTAAPTNSNSKFIAVLINIFLPWIGNITIGQVSPIVGIMLCVLNIVVGYWIGSLLFFIPGFIMQCASIFSVLIFNSQKMAVQVVMK